MFKPRSSLLATLAAAVLFVAPAAATDSAPPAWPDSTHVENGCFISATAYLARFAAEFPAERGLTLKVQPRNYDEPHTVALVTWKGRWWGRDEYCGVFSVGRAVGQVTESLRTMAETALGRRASALIKSGRVALAPATPANLSAERRAHEVAKATALLPGASEQFWIRSGGLELPFLLFRPAAGKVAVYEPGTGTATAETSMTDGAQVVAAVAARLGYAVESVRPDFTGVTGALVAASR